MFDIFKYLEENKKVGKFGINYLDYKLKGILRGDLILIGSRSGAGKSTIAKNIAMANPSKSVKLLSLENFAGDDIAIEVYKHYKTLSGDWNLNVRDFVSGDFDKNKDYLLKAQAMANKKFEHIDLVSRQKGYVVKKLRDDIISAAQAGIGLVIIDHLDYLDKDSPNDNDNTHMTAVMKTIREVQDEYKCAIIAISHLRKSDSHKNAPVVPSMDEFHGSSNKVKEATVVIMLAPDDETNQKNAGADARATWCCVRKLRMGGVDNKTARIYFNTNTNDYLKKYDICSVNYSGTEVKLLQEGIEQ